ncbi:tetratricopeptide repeat protein [Gloeothece verrucosa]|uniref:tetratricopeptide repeat protein n=1 Tax=Gloeothece verrucosa TaxID=2546359 RepID=UPI003CCB042D
MRWILILLTVVLIWSGAGNEFRTGGQSAWAEPVVSSSITEQQIKQGEALAQKAFEATDKGDFPAAEQYWTQLIEQFPTNPAVWSNRGNCRVSQFKLDEAIADFNKAIELAPDSPDPYLNRGTAFEAQERYSEAIADYNQVLALDPSDPMAYNNRGNAQGSLGHWQEALADYQKAIDIAPNFSFAQANVALALYETGHKEEATRKMRSLVRKYPMFPDMRAALTAVLWEQGKQGEAESNWVAAVGIDNRYQDLDWVKNIRRWPPQMVAALDKFLNLN